MTFAHPDPTQSTAPVTAKAIPCPPFLGGAKAVADAAMLAREFGPDAATSAAMRAAQGRARDNSRTFCHWREVERLIDWLGQEEILAVRH